MSTTKTAADYMTQGILWLQTQEDKSPLISVLLCWLMQTKCRSGSQTAHTDGANVWISEKWFSSMSVPHRGYVFAHEAMHGILRHCQQMKQMFGEDTPATRRYWRNANLPFDAWLNYCLSAVLGFRLDDGVYPDSKHPKTGKPLFRDAGSFNPDEHDWLWLYSRLDKDAADGMGGGMGAGDDMIGGATGSEIEAELRAGRAIAQGAARAAARSRGTAGGWLERLLGQATQPVQNWRTQLWDIMSSTTPIDWSMRRCNKTYACAGGLVGTVSSPGMGMGVVAFDTSGSMTDDVLAQPVAEANAIIQQCAPEKLYVLSVDAHVANAQEVTDVFVPELKGGGGTSFVPAFDWVSERVTEDVGFLLYFTDGYGDWENVTPPPYPVIWFIVAGGTKEDPPFGRVIRMME